jgi:hypothetical protein
VTTDALIRIAGVTAAALTLSAATAAAAGVSSADARRAAVRASARTCAVVPWCKGYGVVPARRCRRARDQAVSCAMWFLTARDDRCGGLVTVKRARSGRLDVGMAVPMNCARATSTPS